MIVAVVLVLQTRTRASLVGNRFSDTLTYPNGTFAYRRNLQMEFEFVRYTDRLAYLRSDSHDHINGCRAKRPFWITASLYALLIARMLLCTLLFRASYFYLLALVARSYWHCILRPYYNTTVNDVCLANSRQSTVQTD